MTCLALLCLGACGDGREGAGRGGPPGGFMRGPTLVATQPATLRPIREQVESIGTTVANESVIITAQVTDTVSKVRFDDGDYVQEGDVLVELTNEEETALLQEAEANLDDATTQYERLENLLTQKSVPVSQVDEARARMSAERARYQSVLARLSDRLVRAPFTGLLGFRQVSPGTLMTPGTPITSLDDISVIKLDFSIPEVYLGLITPTMRLVARSSAFPDVSFDAEVRTVGSRIDPVTRAATVRALIDNSDRLLLPGMLLTVKLTTSERSALMVPESALLQRASQAYVFTIRDGVAEMMEVKHGQRDHGWVEITEGLSEGIPVISEGVIKIRNGSAVTTEELSAGPDASARMSTAGDPG